MRTDINETAFLRRYAKAAGVNFIETQADLGSNVELASNLLPWCREQGDIVVLATGDILTSNPVGRELQNCKIVMRNQGLKVGKILPASTMVIQLLLENAEYGREADEAVGVSVQQQRLRVLVKEALQSGASDIHIEVRRDIARIRFRKHGELFLHAEWLPKIAREVSSVAFNKETDQSSTHFNPFVPQNASMPLDIDGSPVRLRLASLPAHGGFDVVMRILTTQDEHVKSLEELGYRQEDIPMIRRAIAMPHGAIIMAGPTGSGKTTTLASCMSEINPDRKLYMIEDPVEKIVRSATQVPVNTEHYDRSFASMARTALRMDPDIMVLGETRDEDTAELVVRAAITGHLILTTLHANRATDIVPRLLDLGVSENLLAGPDLLVCLICQRLVQTLCEHCKEPIASLENDERLADWRALFKDDMNDIYVRRDGGCEHCHGTGVGGRTVIAEIVWVDDVSRGFIKAQDMFAWRKHLQAQGWHTYEHHLFELIRAGRVAPHDGEKVVGRMSINMHNESFHYGEQ